MKTLKLTSSGDLAFENNSFSVIEGTSELDQYIRTILSIRKGEWFLDVNLGLSHENIIGDTFDKSKIEFDIIEALRQEPRVDKINIINIELDRENRKVYINYSNVT